MMILMWMVFEGNLSGTFFHLLFVADVLLFILLLLFTATFLLSVIVVNVLRKVLIEVQSLPLAVLRLTVVGAAEESSGRGSTGQHQPARIGGSLIKGVIGVIGLSSVSFSLMSSLFTIVVLLSGMFTSDITPIIITITSIRFSRRRPLP